MPDFQHLWLVLKKTGVHEAAENKIRKRPAPNGIINSVLGDRHVSIIKKAHRSNLIL